MSESLLSRKKRSAGSAHDAAEKRAGVGAARGTGIIEQTLYTWRRQAKEQGLAVPVEGKNPEGWSSEDKFAVVLETAVQGSSRLANTVRLCAIDDRILVVGVNPINAPDSDNRAPLKAR